MSKRILVADDDPLMRTFVAVCLQDLGEIRQANDGTQALSMLAAADLDLLLLDWDMPAPNGLTVLKTLRAAGITLARDHGHRGSRQVAGLGGDPGRRIRLPDQALRVRDTPREGQEVVPAESAIKRRAKWEENMRLGLSRPRLLGVRC